MADTAREVNFDSIVGPTHNYAGLSYDNVASSMNRHATSSPKRAALQGLAKMRVLHDLGIEQAVLPPHERPDMALLRRIGFEGSDAQVFERAWQDEPAAFAAACSASAMWAANAATVSPSADAADGRVHLTVANLVTHLHRSIEPPTTLALLRAIFRDESHFAVHEPLPATRQFGDEGAANHTRFCAGFGETGVQLFTYGTTAGHAVFPGATAFPARQTLEASRAVARLHRLHPDNTFFVQENPIAIDAGVFHNDVIAVGNQHVLFSHRLAYINADDMLSRLSDRLEAITGRPLVHVEVHPRDVSLRDAIATYLFNSQLVTLADGSMALVCPTECREHQDVSQYLDALPGEGTPIRSVHCVETRESMRNGGGPACLRLRVVLTDAELAVMHQPVRFTPALHDRLTAWVERHYRDELAPADLRDPRLLGECRSALDELSHMLDLPGVYPFQR